ncbi:MAG: hypothetical protein IPH13_17030 [Planctomycetes bacterium]|nr:hypothetical protein [Planctomycetota bacterium]MCC7173045.1 hypothetical protein [Planctomycetota bacterium]
MGPSLCLALALCLPQSGASPWTIESRPAQQEKSLRNEAGRDAAKLSAHAAWCLEHGLYAAAAEALEDVQPLTPEAAKLLGLTDATNLESVAEAARFTPTPSWTVPALNVPKDKARADVVRSRMLPIRKAIQSTYFDLWSDLTDAELKPYSLELNGYYRAFKNQFSAYEPRPIDVLLFANRSDFLLDYALTTGWTAEHTLGYYRPDLQRLVFYHDARNRSEVFETARHECTHLLIDLSFHRAPLPRWFHEGVACYLGGGGLDAADPYTAGLVASLKRDLGPKKTVSLTKLFATPSEKFTYREYAVSWGVIYFLNAGRYQSSYPEFLKELRERCTAAKDLSPAAAMELVTEVFRETITIDFTKFEDEFGRYFRDAFRFDKPAQLVDLTMACLDRSTDVSAEVERDEYREIARRALAVVPDDLSPELLAKRHLTHARAAALAAQAQDLRADSAVFALREVLEHLQAAPKLADESKRAAVVREALSALRPVARSSPQRGVAYDLREALVDRAEADPQRAPLLKALTVVVDGLQEHAFSKLAAALNTDPLDVNAAEQWVWLALESCPARLADVVPTLILLNTADPSDRHRALLGVAYIGLGKREVGKRWVEEGQWLTAGPNMMQPYLDFAGIQR